jgi:hypothetical protein
MLITYSEVLELGVFRWRWLVHLLILPQQGILTERGRIGTVDFLVPTSLDQLLFILKLSFLFFFRKQPI